MHRIDNSPHQYTIFTFNTKTVCYGLSFYDFHLQLFFGKYDLRLFIGNLSLSQFFDSLSHVVTCFTLAFFEYKIII